MGILLTNIERKHYTDRAPWTPYWSDCFVTEYLPCLEISNNRPNLVICFGDSWTWGDSLVKHLTNSKIDDPNVRMSHVYGRKLAEHLDADFVNYAIPGIFNYWIFDRINILLNHDVERLRERYNKVYIIVTLTEIGRDFTFSKYIDSFEKYFSITSHTTGEELAIAAEKFDFDTINLLQSRLPANFQLVVGRNFTYTQNSNLGILNCLLDQTWTEVLFNLQNFTFSKNVSIMSHGIQTFDSYVVSKKLDTPEYKRWFTKSILNPSLEQIKLLEKSKFNFKAASKHPTVEGHQMWADYIFSYINKGQK